MQPHRPFAASYCAPAASRRRRSARSPSSCGRRTASNWRSALDLDAIFGRRAPRCLEIGFGAGEVIGALADSPSGTSTTSASRCIAPAVGRLLLRAEQIASCESARHLPRRGRGTGGRHRRRIASMRSGVLPGSLAQEAPSQAALDRCRLLPSRWWRPKLRGGGVLRLATDWQRMPSKCWPSAMRRRALLP
jgi:hypothetical protein